MKFRLTQKQAREYYCLYRIDNPKLEFIIEHYTNITPFYHAGIYGWNADIFVKGRVGLEYGYRPIAKKCISKELQERIYNKCKKELNTYQSSLVAGKKKKNQKNN